MKLLEPVRIGNLELKNRIVMAPMGPELGNFDVPANAYYLARARGGAAMIMCGVIATEAIDGHTPASQLTEESYAGFQQLVEESHAADCKVCLQVMPGVGLGGVGKDRVAPASASALPIFPGSEVKFQELTKQEIKFIQDEVARTVRLAREAGVDAIEIHAYGGYLTDKFMTKRWNIRTDEYGGDLDGRLRFLTELIGVVKREMGDEFPLIVKFTPCHYLPVEAGYRGMDEGIEIAKRLERLGVHALHVDAGCHDNWFMAMPPIYQQEMVPQMKSSMIVKKAVSIPVISNGRLQDVAKAEAALQNGWIDVAAVGRGFLADPDFPNKVRNHRPDDIRPCISCNEGCIAGVSYGKSIECAVNPLTGHEGTQEIFVTDNPQRILIIGAGPAGCTAAITAKQAGHKVEVWEKNPKAGGNFLAASMPWFKRDAAALLSYYQTTLAKLDVKVEYCQEATAAAILEYAPDRLIWAAGATPIRPASILGIMGDNVCVAADALRELCWLGDSIAVIGGGLVGCETAIHLASRGKKVTVVEMAPKLLPEPVFIQNMMMVLGMMQHPNITVMVGTKLASIDQQGITVNSETGTARIPSETVVLAMGFAPNNRILSALEGKIPYVPVGDSVAPRKVYNAVHEAFNAVASL